MNSVRASLGTAMIGCAVCAGLAAPMTVTSTMSPQLAAVTSSADDIAGLVGSGAIAHADPQDPNHAPADDWFVGDRSVSAGTVLIVTPGTDDQVLYPRIAGLRGDRATYIVVYPESLGPLISGKSGAALPFFAPSYDTSRDIAVDHNLEAMRALRDSDVPLVVYTGYSQGAEALGNAAELAYAAHEINVDGSRILLVSDPRSPWGLKSWAAERGLGPVISLFGAESNGARDPRATGDLPVTSVIIVGDPVSNFQWDPRRPLASLLVDAAGFATIHSGAGSENYATINHLGTPEVLHSADGNTTYLVYRTEHHPLTMLGQMVLSDVGYTPTETQLDRWDTASNAFYTLRAPSVATADEAAPVVGTQQMPAAVSQPMSMSATTSPIPDAAPRTPGGRHRKPDAPDPSPVDVTTTSDDSASPDSTGPKPTTRPKHAAPETFAVGGWVTGAPLVSAGTPGSTGGPPTAPGSSDQWSSASESSVSGSSTAGTPTTGAPTTAK